MKTKEYSATQVTWPVGYLDSDPGVMEDYLVPGRKALVDTARRQICGTCLRHTGEVSDKIPYGVVDMYGNCFVNTPHGRQLITASLRVESVGDGSYDNKTGFFVEGAVLHDVDFTKRFAVFGRVVAPPDVLEPKGCKHFKESHPLPADKQIHFKDSQEWYEKYKTRIGDED